jgi:hypothetical protein
MRQDKENTMTQSTATPDFDEPTTTAPEHDESDLDVEVNDDDNLDVDTPSDELDEAPETAVEGEKAAKAASTPRTKAPDGFVKPVEFAKILSAHLGKTVPPQVVYSYLKNNLGDTAKNPFPVHTVEGDDYAWYIKAEEALAWWDAKNTRVSASKEARAAKAAAKAAKPAAEAEASAEPVVEAE